MQTTSVVCMLRDQCLKLFQNEDLKRDIQGILKSIIGIIYNELYPYVLLICIYNVLLLLLILGILFMLYRTTITVSVIKSLHEE